MKLLVFDMGHVFVDFDWVEVKRRFCQRTGATLARMDEVYLALSKLGYENGTISTAAFIAELNSLLGSDITYDEFVVMFNYTFCENVRMAKLLQKLKTQRPIYLLSNTNEVHYDWLQQRYDVARHFDHLILSYKVQCSKPGEQIYKHVEEASGFSGADIFFTDDLKPNISTAHKRGWVAHQFDGIEGLELRLSELGLSV